MIVAATVATPGAITAALVGVFLATWNLWLTRRDAAPAERIAELERKLGEATAALASCRNVNRWLRYRHELIYGALLRLLPEHDRLDLLATIGDRVPPATSSSSAPELSDTDRQWLDATEPDEGAI